MQARVYLTLVKSGVSSARAIARNAKVAPQDIYRLLNDLAEKGLASKIIDKPTKYRPLPLDEGLEILLKRKKMQMTELEKTVNQISEASRLIQPQFEEVAGEFIIVPEKEAIEKMVDKIFLTAQTSVDMVNDFKEVIAANEKHLDSKRRAIKNHIKIREVICDRNRSMVLPMSLMRLLNDSNVELRKLQEAAPARLIIKDKTEVFFATMVKETTVSSSFMWSNNRILLGIVNAWYDILWSRAMDIIPSKFIISGVHHSRNQGS